MCGAIYNVNEHPMLPGLLSGAGYSQAEIDDITNCGHKPELRPTNPIASIIPTKTGPRLMNATWWLALDKSTLEPQTKWSSFNCQSRRVFESKMHMIAPKSYRAVVLAKGFFEWQPVFANGLFYGDLTDFQKESRPVPDIKRRVLIEHDNDIMYLGALCKHWIDPEGNSMASVGIITLPPHPEFLNVHHKSYPLALRKEELNEWLNPNTPMGTYRELLSTTAYRIEPVMRLVDEELNKLDGSTISTPRQSSFSLL